MTAYAASPDDSRTIITPAARMGEVRAAEDEAEADELIGLRRSAFPALEDELCGMVVGGGYEGPGRSPDRADA